MYSAKIERYLIRYKSKKYATFTPLEIKDIRRSYDLSQESFARLLHISIDTLQNYEIGRSSPSSTAAALFLIAKNHPEVFKKKPGQVYSRFVR